MNSLRDKTISGVFWSFLQKVGSRSIHLGVTIILARILAPKDFGLIGMLSIFVALGQALMNAGFSEALIRKKEVDDEDYSSVFYINLVVSILLYLLLFFGAPWIAEFYHQPILIPLTRVLGAVFIINAFSYVQEARLQKEMRFKTLMLVHLPSTVMSGIVAIFMALKGYGIWSIVGQQIVVRLAYAVQIWIYSKWTPLLSFNTGKAKKLFSFGSRLMFSTIIGAVYENAYLVVIGKFFSPAMLGYYQTANGLIEYPAYTVTNVVSSVTFPVFSSIQNSNDQLKVAYRKVMQQLLFWIAPLFILAGVLAIPLFRFVFTEKWLPSVPYFRWLCIAGVFYPLNIYILTILHVKGRSDVFLRLEIIKRIITTIGIVIAIPFGIGALVIFQAVNAVICYLLNSYYSGRFIDYGIVEQIFDLAPILLLGLGIGGVVWLLESSIGYLPDVVRILGGLGVGLGLYGGIAYLFRLSPWLDLRQMVALKFSGRLF